MDLVFHLIDGANELRENVFILNVRTAFHIFISLYFSEFIQIPK